MKKRMVAEMLVLAACAGYAMYRACESWTAFGELMARISDVVFLICCLAIAVVLIAEIFVDDDDFSSGPAHTDGGAQTGDSGHAGAAVAGSAGPGANHPDCADSAS